VSKLAEAVRKGECVEVEMINYHKNGTPYWVSLCISPIEDAHGKLKGFIAFAKDVTRQREPILERN